MVESALTARTANVITADSVQFACAEGDTLLRAALRAGVAATYECNSGGCGTCKFLPSEGEFTQVQDEPKGLTERDRRKRRMLACQSVPTGDCTVSLVLDPEASRAPTPRIRSGVVVNRRELTHDLTELTVQTHRPAPFLPGQFAMVSLAHAAPDPMARLKAERAYSMSNLPNSDGMWQFQVKEVPGGAVSGQLARTATEGTRLVLDAPYGHAYLRDTGRDVLCIAGGSGLAPMVSVARGLSERADAQDRSLLFFYGGRAVRDLCAEEFVTETADRLHDVTLVEVLSEAEPDTWAGLTGFVHEALERREIPDLLSRDIYIAGPPAMTDAVVRLLVLEMQVPATNVHYDRFF